jgi:flagellar hook-basal body complex protein FliE
MPIPAIGAVSGIGAAPTAAVTGTPSTGAADFGNALTGAVDNLQQLQSTSDSLSLQAVTGNLDDIHDATIASSRAQVTMELVAGVRNKAVDAFNEIMRMQA